MFAVVHNGMIAKIVKNYPYKFIDYLKIGQKTYPEFKGYDTFVHDVSGFEGVKINKPFREVLIENDKKPKYRVVEYNSREKGENVKVVKWYQIYYDLLSQIKIFDEAIPINNPFGNVYFENKVILNIWQEKQYKDCNYISVISTSDKIRQKTGGDINLAMRKIEMDDCKSKVYCFGRHGWDNVWQMGNKHHGEEFSIIAQAIFNQLGIRKDITKLNTLGIYSNYWIATPEIFEAYCTEMLFPVYLIMENDEQISKLVNREIKYTSNGRREDIKYTYHTFIMERLFTTFLTLKGIRAKQLY